MIPQECPPDSQPVGNAKCSHYTKASCPHGATLNFRGRMSSAPKCESTVSPSTSPPISKCYSIMTPDPTNSNYCLLGKFRFLKPRSCPKGKLANGQCEICPPGSTYSQVSSYIKGKRVINYKCRLYTPPTCPEGFVVTGDQCIAPATCPTGYILTDGTMCDSLERIAYQNECESKGGGYHQNGECTGLAVSISQEQIECESRGGVYYENGECAGLAVAKPQAQIECESRGGVYHVNGECSGV